MLIETYAQSLIQRCVSEVMDMRPNEARSQYRGMARLACDQYISPAFDPKSRRSRLK